MKTYYDYWLIPEVREDLVALITKTIKFPLRLWIKCGGFRYKKHFHITNQHYSKNLIGKNFIEWYEIPIKFYLN